MNITTSAGMVGAHADLLPSHTDHTVGRHSPRDPVITTAVMAGFRQVCNHHVGAGRGEPLHWGSHTARLGGALSAVVADPLIESLLSSFDSGECLLVNEEFRRRPAVKPLNRAHVA